MTLEVHPYLLCHYFENYPHSVGSTWWNVLVGSVFVLKLYIAHHKRTFCDEEKQQKSLETKMNKLNSSKIWIEFWNKQPHQNVCTISLGLINKWLYYLWIAKSVDSFLINKICVMFRLSLCPASICCSSSSSSFQYFFLLLFSFTCICKYTRMNGKRASLS